MGIGATVGADRVLDGSTEVARTVPTLPEGVDVDADPPAAGSARVLAATPAATPVDAVESFLEAEAAGDFAASYLLLSDPDRASFSGAASWIAAHADFFPIESFEVTAADGDQVATEVRYRSSLDEVVGLIPARATVTWTAVATGDGWLVDHETARVEPIHPDDDEAIDAVRTWARTLHACGEPDQYDGSLVATADLIERAESLCGRSPPRVADRVGTVDDADTSALVSAFGAPAAGWARTVAITAPVKLTVVLAPVDDRWLVVGLLP